MTDKTKTKRRALLLLALAENSIFGLSDKRTQDAEIFLVPLARGR